jgi:hypothetical protein
MAIFNSYVKLPEGNFETWKQHNVAIGGKIKTQNIEVSQWNSAAIPIQKLESYCSAVQSVGEEETSIWLVVLILKRRYSLRNMANKHDQGTYV